MDQSQGQTASIPYKSFPNKGGKDRLSRDIQHFVVLIPASGLMLGFAVRLYGLGSMSRWIWFAATVPVLLILATEIFTSLKRGDVGLDVVAALSMAAALIFGEEAAACVVALMYASGTYLEDFAEGRATKEMTALLARVPRTAYRHNNGKLEEIDLESIEPGDLLLIRQGDVIPVDGTVMGNGGVVDQSALTGESLPLTVSDRDSVMSGSINVGPAFDLIAARRAAESTYAGIVRLVTEAQRSRAPMARLADKFAIVFLGLTVVLAGGAWLWTGDPIRAVAVLVIATPCPLILAVPVALVSGLSRGAKQGILVKGGKALEILARTRTMVLDKTGTLTYGHARVVSIFTGSNWTEDEVLRVAASLDQASKHVIAQAIVKEAQRRGLPISIPTDVTEAAGEGIEGQVEGRRVIAGGYRFVTRKLKQPELQFRKWKQDHGTVSVAVSIDEVFAGLIILSDELRPEAKTALRELRHLGISRFILASGDSREVTESVAHGLELDVVRAELTPEQKILVVLSERKNGPVMMIGDGVNDAPALAAADVGVAMGAKGAAASAEAADVVLLVDRFDRVVLAVKIARRSRAIAMQSVYAGMGLSIVGMTLAALGFIVPVEGAVLQEMIDVAVILNALRALR